MVEEGDDTGSENCYKCSAKWFVVTVYVKVLSYLAVPISVLADLLKFTVQSVLVLQCAPVVGCWVRSRGWSNSSLSNLGSGLF